MSEVPLYSMSQDPASCGYLGFQDILSGEKEIFIDNLLVRVHCIIEKIVVERPCDMGV